ncbi:MAG TPA: glycosyltransferase family 4 protein [Candidatus Peribacteria bacterium]|nr:glycosyltransferase family 4 protein [Candidatus Peribacteria bacterium]
MPKKPFRSLLLTRHMPSPTRGGSSMRNHLTAAALAGFGPTGVFCLRIGEATPRLEPVPGLAVCEQHHRGMSLTSVLWAVLRSPLSIPGAFERLTFHHDIAAALDRTLESFQPDLVVCVEPWLHAYLPVIRKHGCTVALDLHNIECRLYADVARTAFTPRRRLSAAILRRVACGLEPAFCAEADQIWTCSSVDADAVRTLYAPRGGIHVIPSGIDASYYASVEGGRGDQGPPAVLYCANFAYAPNAEAADALLHLFPRLQAARQDCRLILAGANPTQNMLRSVGDAVTVTGMVSDMRPVLSTPNAVLVVPLLHGSGTRLKILEAFTCGIPVVSTAKGMEGIDAVHGIHALIADGEESIVEQVLRLWKEPALRQQLTANARRLLEERHSPHSVREALAKALADCDAQAPSVDSVA